MYVLDRLMKLEILLLVELTASPLKFSLLQLLKYKLERPEKEDKMHGALSKGLLTSFHKRIYWRKMGLDQNMCNSHGVNLTCSSTWSPHIV